jgi:uncharacterized protein YdaL
MLRRTVVAAVAAGLLVLALGTAPGPGPVAGAAFAATVPASTSGAAVAASATARTLILYDTTGQWAWIGDLWAQTTANLVSHFGAWTAEPVVRYAAGEMSGFTAVVYIGSTEGEPLPTAFLSDVAAATKPVIWIRDNIAQLGAELATESGAGDAPSALQDNYGWRYTGIDFSSVDTVRYKGTPLTRYAASGNGLTATQVSWATVLATAVRSDATTLPWAIRSRNLTYLTEDPFSYGSETDRVLAFDDLLFDALAPGSPTRHRALLRLEDVNRLFALKWGA